MNMCKRIYFSQGPTILARSLILYAVGNVCHVCNSGLGSLSLWKKNQELWKVGACLTLFYCVQMTVLVTYLLEARLAV